MASSVIWDTERSNPSDTESDSSDTESDLSDTECNSSSVKEIELAIKREHIEKMKDVHRRYTRAFQQVQALDRKIHDLEVRIQRAKKGRNLISLQNLERRLSTVCRVRAMYRHYYDMKLEEQRLLLGVYRELVRDSEEESRNYDGINNNQS